MGYFVSVSQAKKIIKSQIHFTSKIELPLLESLGFYTSEPIKATMNVPSFDNSAMDGYGFRFSDISNFSKLKLNGVVPAGCILNEIELEEGQAIRIFTGAKIPKDVDTVVPQEQVQIFKDKIRFDYTNIRKGDNVRLEASQTQKGAIIIEENTLINHSVIGFLAGFGIEKVSVFNRLKIGLLYTGNELVEIGNPLSQGEIYNTNKYTLSAALSEMKHQFLFTCHVNDTYQDTLNQIKNALKDVDVLMITGGISVGDYDFVKSALEELQVQELFYKIDQKPGKPMYFGKKDNTFIFALPGNPASVFSCYHQYVKPFLKGCFGRKKFEDEMDFAISSSQVKKKKLSQTQFLKAHYWQGKVYILDGQESYKMNFATQTNCLVEFPEDKTEIKVGDKVKIWRI